jgi:hypothetical protein
MEKQLSFAWNVKRFSNEGILSMNSNELTKKISAILDEARRQGRPFAIEWRPEKGHSQSHAEYDAGCGCGPVDFPDPVRRG